MSIGFPSADFVPTLSGYTGQGPFRFWCQKVLPIVYDDSLSYYELLNKVVVYLNNVISDIGTMATNMNEVLNAFKLLQDYVNSYLDLDAAVERALDKLAESGELERIFGDLIRGEIDQWLDLHPEATTTVQDGSLTESKLHESLKLKVLNPFVTPQMFGAVGNGVVDDSLAFQSAIAFCIENDAMLFVPHGKYYINNPLYVNNGFKMVGENQYTSVIIAGKNLLDYTDYAEDPETHPLPIVYPVLSFSTASSRTYYLGNKNNNYRCQAGDDYITVDGLTGVYPGDIVRIYAGFSEHPWTSDNRGSAVFGETNVVDHIVGNKIYLRERVAYTFPSSSTVTAEFRHGIKGVEISNLSFRVEPQVTGENKHNYYNGIMLQDCDRAKCENVGFYGYGGTALQSHSSYGTVVDKCHVENCWTKRADGTLYGSAGYGLRAVQDRRSVFRFNTGLNCKHCFDASGGYPALQFEVQYNDFDNCDEYFNSVAFATINTHGPADLGIIQYNVANSRASGRGIMISGERMTVRYNKTNNRIYVIGGGNHDISLNDVSGPFYLTRPDVNNNSRFLILRGNTIRAHVGITLTGIGAGGQWNTDGKPYNIVYGLVCENNLLIDTLNTGTGSIFIQTTYAYSGAIKNGSTWTIDGTDQEISGTLTFSDGCVIRNNFLVDRKPTVDRKRIYPICNVSGFYSASTQKAPDAFKFGGFSDDFAFTESLSVNVPEFESGRCDIVMNQRPLKSAAIGWLYSEQGWLEMGRPHVSAENMPTDPGVQGDIVWNSTPLVGEYIGWVFTGSGWHGFGLITQ